MDIGFYIRVSLLKISEYCSRSFCQLDGIALLILLDDDIECRFGIHQEECLGILIVFRDRRDVFEVEEFAIDFDEGVAPFRCTLLAVGGRKIEEAFAYIFYLSDRKDKGEAAQRGDDTLLLQSQCPDFFGMELYIVVDIRISVDLYFRDVFDRTQPFFESLCQCFELREGYLVRSDDDIEQGPFDFEDFDDRIIHVVRKIAPGNSKGIFDFIGSVVAVNAFFELEDDIETAGVDNGGHILDTVDIEQFLFERLDRHPVHHIE